MDTLLQRVGGMAFDADPGGVRTADPDDRQHKTHADETLRFALRP